MQGLVLMAIQDTHIKNKGHRVLLFESVVLIHGFTIMLYQTYDMWQPNVLSRLG